MNSSRFRRSIAGSLGIVSVLWLTGCSKGPADNAATLTITGSSTVAPLIAEIAKRYESSHAGIRIEVQTGGSSRGLADARKGLAQIGMVSRAQKKEGESDLEWATIASDGVAMIVHAENPVRELSDAQVVDIFTGKINNWSQVGGKDAPITVVNKAEGRSTLEVFLQHFKLDTKTIAADLVVGDNQQGIKTVAGNPDAIGYVSIGSAEYEAGIGVPIRALPASGVEATTAMVAAGKFPLSRPLSLVFLPGAEAPVREFIDYCHSSTVDDLIQAQFFVPVAR